MNPARSFRSLIGSVVLSVLVSCSNKPEPGDDRLSKVPVSSGTTTKAELVVAQTPVTPQPASDQSASDQSASDQSVGDQSNDDQPVKIVEGDFSWPRLLGKGFDGIADSAGVDFDWSRKPSVLWRLPVGTGYGLGCVTAGTYYHADAQMEGTVRVERLRATRLEDAKEIWASQRPMDYQDLYQYESGPRGTPATDGKSIVTYGCDGVLSCRNLSDGSLKWSVATNQKYGVVQNFFGVGSSPLLLDSMVIVPVGGSPIEDQQIAPGRLDRVIPNGSALVAFDLKTGDEVWRCGQDLASYSSPRTMQIGSKTVVLLFARNHLLAVDPAVGKVLWKFSHRASILESVNAMMPVVQGDRIFISECYQVGSVLMKVSLAEPTTIWKDPAQNRRAQSMRCHWSTPALIDGYLYGCSGRNNPDSDFRCVEFATGKVQWTDDRRVRTSVARAGDHLVVLDEYGFMQVIRPNPEKLDVVVEHDFSRLISSPCWAAPIIVGNRILIRGDRNVLCLAIPTK